jgi:hypothetical protein
VIAREEIAMPSFRPAAGLALAALSQVTPFLVAPAFAGAVSFVSVTGDDRRDCSTPANACRTFQRAHNQTSPHGELIALTPGDYRALTINRSISVIGVDGAGIFGGVATTIQIQIAAGPNDAVFLTGLTLDGAGIAKYGVGPAPAALQQPAVFVRKCSIRNMKDGGVVASGRTLVEDAHVSNPSANLSLGGRSLVHRVVAAGAGTSEIAAAATTTISKSSITGGSFGVLAVDGAVFMNRSAITGNATGYAAIGGLGLSSAGDNLLRGNTTDASAAFATIGLK